MVGMSKVQKVRRKALVLEAMQFVDDVEVVESLREWMGLEELKVQWDRGAPQLVIPSPDGYQRLDVQSWIYRTENGGYRGLPDDVYQANFEAVDSGQLTVVSEEKDDKVPSPAAGDKPLTKAEKKAAEAAAKAAEEAKEPSGETKGASGETPGELGETLTITGSEETGNVEGAGADGDSK